ncbi:EamA family transporter [Wohlfahrtiimonas chitiniclastica]|uniref:EamA family transporter n=1 Tax=Wohlfahrtiimonas chitiniclastica TaxID=400946 RepID=A0AB35BX21_9GAMM|nr:DMT family transporter [Wohlfahrtiimonas chitiniclastica]MBS7824304.1 EamA family transporter [Wohlfahrtiimonas chitiniclastica]MBS7834161.1 EamA family transporter [Wohlfahrtiimonas chitiniclastica]MBS7839830.1 EamA family transporter [Wohlfahrtiimonas chitiniclastica]OYQ88102.1 EamA family transporter [Wohlfahrtiimonas chitiniclastica]
MNWAAMLYPLVAVMIWAMNAVVNKLSAGVIEPAAISFYRWVLAFLILTPFCIVGTWRNWQQLKPLLWKFAVLGFLGMAVYQCLAYYAAYTISATMIGIFLSLTPLLTIILSLLILRTPLTVGLLVGSGLSFFGITWLISGGNPAILLDIGIGKGELMMLIAASAYALYGVLTMKWKIQAQVSTWQSLYWQVIFGVLILVPLFVMTDNVAITRENVNLILFAGIPASIIAPFLWLQGVARLGASKTSLFMNLSPLFTAIISILFLHESLEPYHIIGGAICLIGVIIAQRVNKVVSLEALRKRANKKAFE